MSLLKKERFQPQKRPILCDKLKAKSLAGLFLLRSFYIQENPTPLLLHMNRNQMTLMYHNVMESYFSCTVNSFKCSQHVIKLYIIDQ